MASYFDAPIQKFPPDATLRERVHAMTVLLNPLIAAFYNGEIKTGPETFQQNLLDRAEAAGLIEHDCSYTPDQIGVHYDNRMGAGMVPSDVHDLLLILSKNGWVWSKVDVLVAPIKQGTAEGNKIVEFNKELWNGSDGHLGSSNPDMLKVCTAMGSHTTGAIR